MITPGGNAALSQKPLTLSFTKPAGAEVDFTLLQTYADGKVKGDDDMCFYGQPSISKGTVTLSENTATLDLPSIAIDVQKIMVTATLEGNTTFGELKGDFKIHADDHILSIPTADRSERALILAEIYRYKEGWKIRNVGQGFNGGLKALAEYFGVDIEDSNPQTQSPSSINLEKRLTDLAKTDPSMVSLVKNVGISLEKKGGTPEKAKVCLCLDISGSMSSLFRSGKIDTLVKRVLALGLTFDDDGDIDVFLFGKNVHEYGTVDITSYNNFSKKLLDSYRLEGGTRYGDAMERIRAFYKGTDLPVFVMFVTDGSTDDKAKTKKMLTQSAEEPFFWKMMGIIPNNSFAKRRSGFLQELDDLPGRKVDNCDFFNVTDPGDPDDVAFFDNVMEEYPEWLRDAKIQKILV